MPLANDWRANTRVLNLSQPSRVIVACESMLPWITDAEFGGLRSPRLISERQAIAIRYWSASRWISITTQEIAIQGISIAIGYWSDICLHSDSFLLVYGDC